MQVNDFPPHSTIKKRYYKFILPTRLWFKVQLWFNIHRTLMTLVLIFSLIAFIIILAYLDWEWVEEDAMVEFAHSIIGILAIGFSVIQV